MKKLINLFYKIANYFKEIPVCPVCKVNMLYTGDEQMSFPFYFKYYECLCGKFKRKLSAWL